MIEATVESNSEVTYKVRFEVTRSDRPDVKLAIVLEDIAVRDAAKPSYPLKAVIDLYESLVK